MVSSVGGNQPDRITDTKETEQETAALVLPAPQALASDGAMSSTSGPASSSAAPKGTKRRAVDVLVGTKIHKFPTGPRLAWGPEGTVFGLMDAPVWGDSDDSESEVDPRLTLLRRLATFVNHRWSDEKKVVIRLGEFTQEVSLAGFFYNRGLGDFFMYIPPVQYLHDGILCSLRTVLTNWMHLVVVRKTVKDNKMPSTLPKSTDDLFDLVFVRAGDALKPLKEFMPFMSTAKHDGWFDMYDIEEALWVNLYTDFPHLKKVETRNSRVSVVSSAPEVKQAEWLESLASPAFPAKCAGTMKSFQNTLTHNVFRARKLRLHEAAK